MDPQVVELDPANSFEVGEAQHRYETRISLDQFALGISDENSHWHAIKEILVARFGLPPSAPCLGFPQFALDRWREPHQVALQDVVSCASPDRGHRDIFADTAGNQNKRQVDFPILSHLE